MNINIHHVGGRSGSSGFPYLMHFNEEIIRVMYDADEECIDQIKMKLTNNSSKNIVLNECISGKKESTTFSINYDPNTSSILNFNSEFNNYYYSEDQYDYVLSEVMQTVRKVNIVTTTLDSICIDEKAPFPDIISLDTQGSELDILTGADVCIKNTLAIITEIEFRKVYSGQPIFGDINDYLLKKGLLFMSFENLQTFSPYRSPLGLRGRGVTLGGDALFLRSPESILESDLNDSEKYFRLRKLAFIAITYNFFEIAVYCLNISKDLKQSPEQDLKYLKFLSEIERNLIYFNEYPKTFSQAISKEQSFNRFKIINNHSKFQLVKHFIKKTPFFKIVQAYRALKTKFKCSCEKPFFAFRVKFSQNSPIEVILLKYGFINQAKEIKEKRIARI